MKCCAGMNRLAEAHENIISGQELVIEILVTGFDEIHEHLRIALQELSQDHPAEAAARIGRCMQILEMSTDEANESLEQQDDEE